MISNTHIINESKSDTKYIKFFSHKTIKHKATLIDSLTTATNVAALNDSSPLTKVLLTLLFADLTEC